MEQSTAIDLFAGAGGATAGLRRAGFTVVGAIENDADAAQSFRMNHPKTRLIEADIRTVDAAEFRRKLGLRSGSLKLLKACPPCQGFSSLASGGANEARNDLVLDVTRFAIEFKPRAILLENVPGLIRDRRLFNVVEELGAIGYRFVKQVVDASRLGVPQRRKRLIVIGLSPRVQSKIGESVLDLIPGSQDLHPRTVADAFRELARTNRNSESDPLNKYRNSSGNVLARIKAVPVNGNRFDLPSEHQLACHMKLAATGRRNATASYGRLRYSEPAPTMTTRCTTPACGSFIHPTEDRGITLREAAVLQTFPVNYQFFGTHQSIERQIGNAVPVHMAKVLGSTIMQLLG